MPSQGNASWFCQDCGEKRSQCTCKPKCEFSLSDQITRDLVKKISTRIENLCEKVHAMGWGYRLAVQTVREKPERWNDGKPIVYQMRYCILIPGASPPPGKWTVYGPWDDNFLPQEVEVKKD